MIETKATVGVFVSVLFALAIVSCTQHENSKPSPTGTWVANRVLNDTPVEKLDYVLNLNNDLTYHMVSTRSRKVDDHDYYAKISGSEFVLEGEWEASDDGRTITFLVPEEDVGKFRDPRFVDMVFTVSADGGTLTRSDDNAQAALLVFTRD